MWKQRPLNQNVIKKWPFTNIIGRATIWDIAQDQVGFLWVATSEGIVRFDGINVKVYDLSNTPAFESQDFAQVEVGADGKVWASGRSGLYYLQDEKFLEWQSDSTKLEAVYKLIATEKGGLLVLASGKPYLIDGEQLVQSPFGLQSAFQLKQGMDGRIWVILNDGRIRYIKDNQLHIVKDIEEQIKIAIRMVVDDADGNLYLSLDDERILYYSKGEFTELETNRYGNDIGLVRNLFPDTHGYVWASSITGTYRFNKSQVDRLSLEDGLSDNGVRTVFEDKQGDIWIGTFRGLNYIRKSPVGLVQVMENGSPVQMETKSVIEAPNGLIWVGTDKSGLFLLQNEQLVKPRAAFRIPENIFTLFVCRNGDLLIGGRNGLIRARYENETLRLIEKIHERDVRFAYETNDGVIWINSIGVLSEPLVLTYRDGLLSQVNELPNARLRWMYQLENNDILFGTMDGLFERRNGAFRQLGRDLELSVESFSNLWPGTDAMWIIAEGNSLIRYLPENDSLTVHNFRNGFGIKSPTSIMMDNDYGVWFSALSGLYRISLNELRRNMSVQDSLNNVEYYPANVAVSPAGYPMNWKANNGVIYYTSPNGLVVVNEKFRDARVKNYQIEAVNVDGINYNPDQEIQLRPYSNKIVFSFSTIDFANQGELSFEFKLEGFDEEWYKIDNVRDVFYTNLPAGNYRFRLREVSSEGFYEDIDQAISISKPKFWYKTNLAIICYVFLFIALATMATRRRTYQVRLQNDKLQALVKSRTAELEDVLASLEQKVEERTASLKRAIEQLNLAMEAGQHAPFRWYEDDNGNIFSEYSDRYYEILGYEPQEFELTWDWWVSAIHPEDRANTLKVIQEAIDSQKTDKQLSGFFAEYRIRKKDGEYIWVESNAKMLASEQGPVYKTLTGVITNVSKRKEAELERIASEERFRKVFDASTSALLLVDAEGKIVMQNGKAEEIFEYKKEEWGELHVEDLIPGQFKNTYRQLSKAHQNTESTQPLSATRDLYCLTRSRRKVPVQIGISPVQIKDTKYTLAIVVDMTERVRMEKDLEEHRRQLQIERDRYANVFHNINDAIFVMDVEEDGRFKFAEFNKAEEDVTGFKNKEVQGRYTYDVFPQYADYLDWRYSTCRDTRQIITYQEQLELKTGLKEFKTSLVPIIENDRVFRIVGIAHDITDLMLSERKIKDKEEKLRYALQASQDAILDWNLENGLMEFSEAFYRMLEYEKGEIKENLDSLLGITNPSDIEEAKKEDLIAIVNDLPADRQFSSDFRMKKKSGEWLWVLLKGKVVERNEKGKAMRFVGTITDITGEKQKTKERLETILKTEDNERGRISREIHDGLQQTLTITALNMEFARREAGSLSDKAQEKFETGWSYLQKSIAESRTVAHSLMPKAILDFGLVSACNSLIMQYNESIEETDFQFFENLGEERIPDKNVEVTLYRILQEAINNIIKYAKATEVSVQLRRYDDMYMLTIEDNGIGFNINEVKENGKGFGLTSMQNRIDAIYGHLEIDSSPGRGTVIIVEIANTALV